MPLLVVPAECRAPGDEQNAGALICSGCGAPGSKAGGNLGRAESRSTVASTECLPLADTNQKSPPPSPPFASDAPDARSTVAITECLPQAPQSLDMDKVAR